MHTRHVLARRYAAVASLTLLLLGTLYIALGLHQADRLVAGAGVPMVIMGAIWFGVDYRRHRRRRDRQRSLAEHLEHLGLR